MKQRENSRLIAERKNGEGELLCLVPICDELRQKYKTSNNTRNYCKDHTYQDMYEFTSWVGLREKVLRRDNYTCVKCGDNRRDVVVTIKSKQMVNWNEWKPNKEFKPRYEIREREETSNNLIGDHIIPIALGGDEFDINNIQTLCLKCNKIKTAKDIKDIAILRRKEKLDNYKNMKIIK